MNIISIRNSYGMSPIQHHLVEVFFIINIPSVSFFAFCMVSSTHVEPELPSNAQRVSPGRRADSGETVLPRLNITIFSRKAMLTIVRPNLYSSTSAVCTKLHIQRVRARLHIHQCSCQIEYMIPTRHFQELVFISADPRS